MPFGHEEFTWNVSASARVSGFEECSKDTNNPPSAQLDVSPFPYYAMLVSSGLKPFLSTAVELPPILCVNVRPCVAAPLLPKKRKRGACESTRTASPFFKQNTSYFSI